MDQNYIDIVTKVGEPIAKESAVGVLLVDDEEFDFIDDEMMKIGSLSHGSIEWSKVEHKAIGLLYKKSKDIKLLSYLLQCLQRDADAQKILCSIQSFEVFINNYWFDSFPSPGEKGKGLRNRFFKQIMQRNSQAVKRVDEATLDPVLVNSVLDKLEKAVIDNGLDIELFARLKAAFSVLEQKVDTQPLVETTAVTEQQGVQAPPDLPKVYFDAKSERTTRQALLAMASFLNQSDVSNVLGYRVRRHALWFAIRQLPSCKKDKVTELAAFSLERYQDYQNAVEKAPSVELLTKLERSIEQSPFWFDGHHLSYQLNLKLSNPQVAKAIQEEVMTFVSKFPEILKYCASDGTAFASESTQAWLQKKENSSQQESGSEHDWHHQYQRMVDMAEKLGLREALNFIDMQLQQVTNTREEYYWRLISADLLNQQKLSSLAKNEYQVLLSNIKDMSINDWEPSFAGHLNSSLKNMEHLGL